MYDIGMSLCRFQYLSSRFSVFFKIILHEIFSRFSRFLSSILLMFKIVFTVNPSIHPFNQPSFIIRIVNTNCATTIHSSFYFRKFYMKYLNFGKFEISVSCLQTVKINRITWSKGCNSSWETDTLALFRDVENGGIRDAGCSIKENAGFHANQLGVLSCSDHFWLNQTAFIRNLLHHSLPINIVLWIGIV